MLHFVDVLNDNFLYQHITEPTRARVGQKANTLDLIVTNVEEIISDITYEAPLGKSDNSVIKASILCSPEQDSSTAVKYSYNKGNFDGMWKN
jgi:hypothetical protein